MGKVRRLFVCSSCEHPAGQWSGKCAACGAWGTVGEHPAGSVGRVVTGGRPLRIATLAADPEEHRISTGFPGFDRVLGGGLVPGSTLLLAGAPGIGKSTLLLQVASHLSRAGHPCLVASGEEGRGQVAARARRLGLPGEDLGYVPGRDLEEVLEAARFRAPAVLIVDSVQTIRNAESDSLPGGPGQVRICADALIGLAKDRDMTLILAGHVTKDGDIAGPRTLEHAVDVVLTFEGDSRSGLRILAAGKNRFGPEGEVAWFDMRPSGLLETDTGTRIGDGSDEPGCATALTLAGRRALAVEVQALVMPTNGPARRQVSGLDPRRFHILSAVTDRVFKLNLAGAELFGASTGGLHLDDPGTDLALVAALASAGSGNAHRQGVGFVGEVSLTGTVRDVAGMDQRIAAAASAGLHELIVGPDGSVLNRAEGVVRVRPVRHVREAFSWIGGR